MEDDNPAVDTGEGSDELYVKAAPGDEIIWRAVSVDLAHEINLTQFIDESGSVFQDAPVKNTDGSRSGITSDAVGNNESYTFHFTINGEGDYSRDPKIKVKPSGN